MTVFGNVSIETVLAVDMTDCTDKSVAFEFRQIAVDSSEAYIRVFPTHLVKHPVGGRMAVGGPNDVQDRVAFPAVLPSSGGTVSPRASSGMP